MGFCLVVLWCSIAIDNQRDNADLCPMFFMTAFRNDPQTNRPYIYYRLVENYRNIGNRSDSTTLGDMIDKLRLSTSELRHRATVVIDAGIATESNLEMTIEKGYDYVCVSRSNLKKYSRIEGQSPVYVEDHRKRKIELVEVRTENQSDREYYLKESSPHVPN